MMEETMTEPRNIINTGLRGVPVASTRICKVDGNKGKLIYRGYNITELAGQASFEEVIYLLLFEDLPNKQELSEIKNSLAANSALPAELIAALRTRPKDSLPMDILQACVAMLANHDPKAGELTMEKTVNTAVGLIAKFPGLMGAWHRIRNGFDPVDPKPELGHAGNFLYMLTGEIPDEQTAGFMDT